MVTVGILGVQGNFAAHARAVTRARHAAVVVRHAEQLNHVDALILPGGESTAMLHGIARNGLDPALRRFFASGRPVLGTCAGAILLARTVCNPDQTSYGALDMDIERNAYGTQLDSFEGLAQTDEPTSPFADLPCMFIRAPRIRRTGPAVTVHARIDGAPVLVSSGPIWAATFHPEMTDDLRVLQHVLGAPEGETRETVPA